jgi:hypothetical protein
MKISIEKPKENVWKFPCLGQLSSGTKVYFTDWEIGVVVESYSDYKIGYTSDMWNMDKFTPIDINGFELNKQEPIDWDKVELPIWYKDTNGAIIKIDTIDKEFVCGFIIQEDASIRDFDHYYQTIDERNQSLSKIKFLPKGTKITIEL